LLISVVDAGALQGVAASFASSSTPEPIAKLIILLSLPNVWCLLFDDC
jgi:hypothetical protein